MANKRIYVDKTELVLTRVTKNNARTCNVTYSDIRTIRIEPCTERKLGLIPVQSEQIMIEVAKDPNPFVFTKMQNKEFFEEYKTELRKWAKDNRVTLHDSVK